MIRTRSTTSALDVTREPHASAAHNTSHPTLDAARSAGGTRGEALVLSDNRTAPIGCALMAARLLRVDDAARAALHLRVDDGALDFVSHSTLHRKSRSPRQRARGLRPSCHPALRAGVLGGVESAARERARINGAALDARCVSTRQQRASRRNTRRTPRVSARQQRASLREPRRMQCVSARQQRASRREPRRMQCVSARQQRAIRRKPRRTPRASAGGTRGEALVLSDIRTASIGCASSPAQCPR